MRWLDIVSLQYIYVAMVFYAIIKKGEYILGAVAYGGLETMGCFMDCILFFVL